jgi:hypothetical protein
MWVKYRGWISPTSIKIATNLDARRLVLLTENALETSKHHSSIKWLRYYLDFCTKYSFEWIEPDSLSAIFYKTPKQKSPAIHK